MLKTLYVLASQTLAPAISSKFIMNPPNLPNCNFYEFNFLKHCAVDKPLPVENGDLFNLRSNTMAGVLAVLGHEQSWF